MVDYGEGEVTIGVETLEGLSSLREQSRDSLETLGTEQLADVYGLSFLPGYEDDNLVKEVEILLDTKMKDPVSARFTFAYFLACDFYDKYELFGRDYDDVNEIEAHKKLEDKITPWLMEGLKAQPNNEAFLAGANYIANRIHAESTFLSTDSIVKLEDAAGKKLTLESTPGIGEQLQKLQETKDKL